MELRIVKALVDKGVSLQEIRHAANLARGAFRTEHPFASRPIFTDGRRVFAGFARSVNAGDLIELSEKNVLQVIAGGVLEPFLEEIEFDKDSALAKRWWPLGRRIPVLLDPRISFGAPVIEGTRIRTLVLAGMSAKTSPEETAKTYQLSREQVQAAVRFEEQLAAA
jgi:uncharacterized protein (DUF433 family)